MSTITEEQKRYAEVRAAQLSYEDFRTEIDGYVLVLNGFLVQLEKWRAVMSSFGKQDIEEKETPKGSPKETSTRIPSIGEKIRAESKLWGDSILNQALKQDRLAGKPPDDHTDTAEWDDLQERESSESTDSLDDVWPKDKFEVPAGTAKDPHIGPGVVVEEKSAELTHSMEIHDVGDLAKRASRVLTTGQDHVKKYAVIGSELLQEIIRVLEEYASLIETRAAALPVEHKHETSRTFEIWSQRTVEMGQGVVEPQLLGKEEATTFLEACVKWHAKKPWPPDYPLKIGRHGRPWCYTHLYETEAMAGDEKAQEKEAAKKRWCRGFRHALGRN